MGNCNIVMTTTRKKKCRYTDYECPVVTLNSKTVHNESSLFIPENKDRRARGENCGNELKHVEQ